MSFPDDSPVEVRYPVDGTPTKTSAGTTVYISDAPRESWPWLPGVIEQQCGPDEWQVTVLARQVAELQDGTRAPEGTPDEQLYYPSVSGTPLNCGRRPPNRRPGCDLHGRHA